MSFKPKLEDIAKYRIIRGYEYDFLYDEILEQILKSNDKPTKEKWESAYSGWLKEDRNLPVYLTDNNKTIYRWNSNFIECEDTQLEKKFLDKLLYNIFDPKDEYLYEILNHTKQIVEFGAGTGHNLITLSKTWIGKKYLGFDFCPSAVEIMKKKNIPSFEFDMYKPNYFWNLKDSIVLTVGAMEQLGENYGTFLDYLLASEAKLMIHIEPIIEFYNPEDSFDNLAVQYHKKRNYLGQFLTKLKEKKVNIIHQERTSFGNIFNEGYSVIVWSRN